MFVPPEASAPPPATVEVVVVNPPRLAPLGGEAAFAAQQIDATTIKENPRLDDALKQVPGVSLFRRTGSEAANPTIQGLSLRSIAGSGAGRALVTLDGAPQNDPFGGWVIWSGIPPEILEGATVVRGAGAGPYGAGALTGVVTLQERGARDGLSALDISGGERGTGRLAVVGGSTNLLVAGSVETSDGYIPVHERRGAADTPTTLHDASFSARWQHEMFGADGAVRISGYEERRGAGLQGANSVASGAAATFTLAQHPSQGVGGWRLQGWVRASNLTNTSVAVSADRSTTTPANDQYDTPALGYGFNGALQGVKGDFSWEMGADVRMTQGTDHERFRNMNGAFTRTREAGGKTATGGVYVEGVLDRDDLLLTGGLRIDGWKNYDAKRIERDAATGLVTLNSPSGGDSGTEPTGRLGVKYSLSDAVYVRTAAYVGFRPPTLNELHRPFRVGNDVTEANPTLKPETLYGVEAGIGGQSAVKWSATAFYNWLKDPITNVTIGAGPGNFPIAGFIPAGGTLRQRQNAGLIKAYGVEGDASTDIAQTVSLQAAFSWTHAEVDGQNDAPQLTGLRPAQTPRLTVTAGGAWRASDRLTLSSEVRYESMRFEDDQNLRRLKASTGVDARASWATSKDSEVYLAAENLFDADIPVGQTADGVTSYASPRQVRVGFTIRR